VRQHDEEELIIRFLRWLHELGAERVLPLGMGDDNATLEEVGGRLGTEGADTGLESLTLLV
jgi:hypothetical protein